MYTALFEDFMASEDTLRVYEDAKLLFSSGKDRLLAWLEYMAQSGRTSGAVAFDKVMGNAAALLAINTGCREVFSPLGSEMAAATLDAHGVRRHLTEIVPHIRTPDGLDMCPMEKLSLGKGPAEFYEIIRLMTGQSR